MNKAINIGILGLGNVGGGAYDILNGNKDLIRKRIGVDYQISRILEINPEAIRKHHVPESIVTSDASAILDDDSCQIVIEALGGIEPSTEFMLRALKNKKSVVTPNKAAVAANYSRLFGTAKEYDQELRIEACVCGGIPVLTAIQESLAANHFTEIMGIVNGTTNYILCRMADAGLSYEEALKEAQKKGFAEQDPTADVEGIDCANKLSILMALAFDRYIPPEEIPRMGLSNVSRHDLALAKGHDAALKLIAHAKITENGELTYSVKPEEVPRTNQLYNVENEMNAIYIKGDAIGETMFYGPGAGPLPTGSAIAGDVIAIMRNKKLGGRI